jgi:hypothetical protein
VINHVRTLLLNRTGASRPAPDFFLEEYVEPKYVALQLPAALAAFHSVLIGDADDAEANYRLWQCARILHATEFAEYVIALDERVTYLHDRSVVNESFGASAEALNSDAQSLEVFFSGKAEVGSPSTLYREWLLELDSFLLRSTDIRTGSVREDSVALTDELTGLVPLAGQADLQVRLGGLVLPSTASWRVISLSQPVGDLSDLLEPLGNVAERYSAELFGAKEPYRTFKELWDKHAYIQYRLSGLLLAYAYRAEEVRAHA